MLHLEFYYGNRDHDKYSIDKKTGIYYLTRNEDIRYSFLDNLNYQRIGDLLNANYAYELFDKNKFEDNLILGDKEIMKVKYSLVITIIIIGFSLCSCGLLENEPQTVTTVPIETLPYTEAPTLVPSTPNPDITIRTAPSYIPIDEEILGVRINMNIILIDELLGDFIEEKISDSTESIGIYLIRRYYEFGRILLVQESYESKEDSKVAIVEITEQGYLGPCNVEVGDTLEEVMSKLGITEDYIKNKQKSIYDGTDSDDSVGSIWYEHGSTEDVNICLYYDNEEILGELYFEFENGELALFGIRKPVY